MNKATFPRSWFLRALCCDFSLALAFLLGGERAFAQRPMGTDVSSYQGGGINWTTIKGDGVSFAWTKATEGTYYIDADFGINETNAKNDGVLIGAYHFARPHDNPNITGANSADTEAQYFWNVASRYVVGGGKYLVPMLDWEDVYVTNAGLNFTASKMSQWVNQWCNDVSNYTYTASGIAIRPVVYTGTWYSEPGTYPGLTTAVTGWPSWIASYPSCTGNQCGSTCPQTCAPPNTFPWSTWNIWQYGDTNWSGGDSDVFNGTMSQFISLFVIGQAVPSATAGATIYWDPGAHHSSPGSGGTGYWDTYTGSWWQSGSSDVAWSSGGNYAVFAGTAGTATVDDSMSVDGMTFNTAGYTIGGTGTLTLTGTTPTITVPAGSPTYISCLLGGSGYTLTGGGIAVLENAGNFSGSSTSPEIVNGPNTTLVVLSDHDTGNDTVPLDLKNGGIYQDNDTTSGDQFLLPGCTIALLTGGGILDNPNASLTMSNQITGAGSLTFTGYTNSGGTPYVLTLTCASNSYSGGTIVQGPGELKANAAGTLGSTSAPLTVSGGILDLNATSQSAGTVTISGGKIQNGTLTGTSYAGQGGTVTAVLTGSAAMTKSTTGTLTLSAANIYTGITTITAGLLQVSSDGNLGAAPGSPVANRLTLNNGSVSSGLRNTASYTMNVNRGITLVGPNGGSIQSTTGQTVTYPNVITGSGGLGIGSSSSLGYGISILKAANTYTGPTTIAAGTLRLQANGTLPYGTSLTIAPDNNGSGGGGVFDMNSYNQTIGPLATTAGIGGAGSNTPTILLTGALTVIQTNINTTFSGAIVGAGGSLTITGSATLTLAGTNTYTGGTSINAGKLALAATGSINNTTNISIAAGATLDVSALAAYTLGGSTTFSASGTASPATINGGTTVSLGSQPITLTYDGSDPVLAISQGTLSLNGNAITVNGPLLTVGTYTLIQQASGNISGSVNTTVTGTAIPASGAIASISVAGGSVILAIVNNTTTTTLGALSPSTYGQSVSFVATVAPPPNGGTVQFYDNGVALGNPVPVSGGTATYTSSLIGVGNHPISAAFGGIPGYIASSTTNDTPQSVNAAPLSVTANPQSKVYGTLLTFGSGSTSFSSTGLQNSETIGSVTLAVSGNGGDPSAPVGTYTITPSAATGGTFLPINYNITYNPGTLTVTLPSNTIPVTILDIAMLPSGFVQMDFSGTPGYVYTIQAASDLTPPVTWTAIGTNAADTNGLFNFVDTNAPNNSQCFYRTVAN